MRRALSFLLPAAKLAPIPIGLFLAAYFVLLESYAAGPLASVGLALAAACLCLYAGAGAYIAARVALEAAAPPSPLADPAKPYRLQVAAETPDGLAAVAASVLARWPREPGPAKGRVCYRLTTGGVQQPLVETIEAAPDAPRRLAFPVALRRAEGGGWLAECPETRAAEGRTWSPPDAAAVVELDAPADLEPGAPAEAPRGSGPAAEVAAEDTSINKEPPP